jgi:DNA-binding NarL/FixJ family response regulator
MPSEKHRKKEEYNKNWEAEIAEFDAESEAAEKEFRQKNIVFDGKSKSCLTDEENEVFEMVLRGVPVSEIADQFGVEEDLIIGLIEVIRAKLSLPE